VPVRGGEIAKLKPEEKARLIQRNERFLALSPTEQDRLRKFHEKISSAGESQRLLTALSRYNEWLKTLTPQQQAELVGLSIDKRLAKIREIQQIQVQAHFWQLAGRLEKEDLELIYSWMEDLVWRHQDAILAKVDPNWAVRVYSTIDPRARRGMLVWRVFGQRGTPASDLLPPAAAEDFALLATRLPSSLQVQLAAQTTDEERRDLIVTCARVAWWSRNSPPPPSDEELRKFFATLDPAVVERVEKLDQQQMKRELIRLYQFRRLPDGRGRGSENSGGFGAPRGDGRGLQRGAGERPRSGGPPEPIPGSKTKTGGQTKVQPPGKS
jgi:hypothetical protein